MKKGGYKNFFRVTFWMVTACLVLSLLISNLTDGALSGAFVFPLGLALCLMIPTYRNVTRVEVVSKGYTALYVAGFLVVLAYLGVMCFHLGWNLM